MEKQPGRNKSMLLLMVTASDYDIL